MTRIFVALAFIVSTTNAVAQRGGYAGPAEDLDAFPITTDVAETDMPRERLDRLRQEVEETGGEALVVMHDGAVVFQWHDAQRRPIECMSATKSIVALGVGVLLAEERLESLDVPVAEILPEFAAGDEITIRMLLTHTSGLSGAMATQDIYQADDIFDYAIDATIERPVGESFAYNNNGVNLLMAVIGARAGKPADEFIAESIFSPLGITAWSWYRDPAGNPHGMAGCKLLAHDLAKIGQLMLDGGAWNGEQIVPAKFVDACTRPSQDVYPRLGLLWWLIEAEPWARVISAEAIQTLAAHATIDPDAIASLESISGTTGTQDELTSLIEQTLGDETASLVMQESRRLGAFVIRRLPGPTAGYYADGYLGQFLFVFPDEDLIVVRQQQRRDHPKPLNARALISISRDLVAP